MEMLQVRQIAAAWRQEVDAKAAVASGQHGPQRLVAPRMRSSVRVNEESGGAGPSAPRMMGATCLPEHDIFRSMSPASLSGIAYGACLRV